MGGRRAGRIQVRGARVSGMKRKRIATGRAQTGLSEGLDSSFSSCTWERPPDPREISFPADLSLRHADGIGNGIASAIAFPSTLRV